MSRGGLCTVRSKLCKLEYVCGKDPLYSEGGWGSLYSGAGAGALFRRGYLYGEVQCIMGNGQIGTITHGQTDTTENITLPHLRWWAVKNTGIA